MNCSCCNVWFDPEMYQTTCNACTELHGSGDNIEAHNPLWRKWVEGVDLYPGSLTDEVRNYRWFTRANAVYEGVNHHRYTQVRVIKL